MLKIHGNVCEFLIGKVCASFPEKMSQRSIVVISGDHMSLLVSLQYIIIQKCKRMAVLVIVGIICSLQFQCYVSYKSLF